MAECVCVCLSVLCLHVSFYILSVSGVVLIPSRPHFIFIIASTLTSVSHNDRMEESV